MPLAVGIRGAIAPGFLRAATEKAGSEERHHGIDVVVAADRDDRLHPVARVGLKGGEKELQAHVPGAAGQAHHVFPDASHFIQEDVPDELVERMLTFIRS